MCGHSRSNNIPACTKTLALDCLIWCFNLHHHQRSILKCIFAQQVINVLEHQNDNPRAIPPRELAKLIYGRDSVFARSPTQAQVGGGFACAVI